MSNNTDTEMTQEEFRQLSYAPSEALALLEQHVPRSSALGELIGRLEAGLLNAYAEDLVTILDGERSHQTFIGVTPAFWRKVGLSASSALWTNGSATGFFAVRYQAADDEARAFGIRFQKTEVEKILSAYPARLPPAAPAATTAPALPPPSPPPTRAGGAPTKKFWEPLLIEIMRLSHEGDLQPTKQADVESAMHDWLVANGHEASERSVRERARLVWQVLKP